MTDAWRIIEGDCRETLKGIPDGSVQCCVTSPPYYGLRDYGHSGQMGLEASPREYVAKMVDVFREVRRVLRDDGTLWLNLGDSYNSAASNQNGVGLDGKNRGGNNECGRRSQVCKDLKVKDLLGIPWRVAFALQDDGWYLRQDIIWAKPSPMPESVTDRCTKAHEYVFLLTKASRYFYDADAIKEDAVSAGKMGMGFSPERALAAGRTASGNELTGGRDKIRGNFSNRRSVWTVPSQPYADAHFATFPPALVEPMILAGTSEHGCCASCGSPYRRVTEKTRLKRERPNEYVKRSGEAGTGNSCANTVAGVETKTLGWEPSCTCGAPAGMTPSDMECIDTPTGSGDGEDDCLVTGRAGYNRERSGEGGKRPVTRYEQRMYAVQLKQSPRREEMEADARAECGPEAWSHYVRTDRSGARPVPETLLRRWIDRGWLERVTVPAWEPPGVVPCLVLDPFSGAGTTGVVSRRLGRRYVGCELNPTYAEMSRKRIRDDNPLFHAVAEVAEALPTLFDGDDA